MHVMHATHIVALQFSYDLVKNS